MPDYKIGLDFVVNNKSGREIADAVGKALNEASKGWNDHVKEDFARALIAGWKYAARSGQSGAAIQDFLRTNITEVYSKFHKELQAGNVQGAAKLDRLMDKRVRQFEREVQAQVNAWEAMQERSAQTWSQKADKFRDTVDDINRSMHMKDPSGYLGLGRQLGGSIQQAGRARQQEAVRMKERGGDPEAAAKMASRGAAIAKIGTALTTVAALAAAVLALIKLFMDLNDRIVDMNKAILQTGTVSDMGIGGRAWEAADRFNRELATMREDVLSASSALDGFRVSSDEMFASLGALNEYGRGFERISESIAAGSKHIGDYGDAAENVVAYSKLMGMSIQEMGQLQSRWANDFGKDLERVYEGLSAVRQEAVLSGFSMKRFVGIIAEATTGMGSYSVRLEEAAKTLKFLSNMMGETAGAELFKSLTNAFTEASTQDRLREILTTGQDEMAKIFADQAASNAESLFRDISAQFEIEGVHSGEDLMRQLASMNEQQRTEMMANLQVAGAPPEMIMRLDNLVETVRAGNGDLNAMVNAMSDLGPAGTLATLTQSQVFGGRMLHEFVAEEGAAGRAAAEQLTGRSGKQFDALVDASRATSAGMAKLRQVQEAVRDDGRKLSKAEQAQLAQLYGATVTQTGEIVGATVDLATGQVEMGDKIKDEQGLMLAQNDRYKKAEEEAVSEDIKLARQVAQSTEKLANVMEANMLQVLNKIYKAVYNFWMDFLRLIGKEDPGEQARVGAANRLVVQGQNIEKYMRQNNKFADDLRKYIETEKDPIKKAGAERQLQALLDTNKKLEEMNEVNDMARDILANMDTSGKTQAEVMKDLHGQLKEQGYDLGINTLDENAARAFTLKMGEEMDNFWPTLADRFEDSADAGQFGQTAHTLGFSAAQEAGITDFRSLRIADAAAAAAESAKAGGANWEEAYPAIEAAINREIMKMANESDLENLMDGMWTEMRDIKKNTFDAAEAAKDQNVALAGGQPAGDFLIRPGQKPIITDPNDTIMGFKPGGAFGIGEGGGGSRGPVNVNIYGGDPQKVYQQVMRVMKTLGHA
jgi:hypothetical protein